MMSKKKLVIFDFDGTIVNSLNLALKFYNYYGPKLGTLPITLEEFRDLGGVGAMAMLKIKKISWWKALFLVIWIRKKIYQEREKLIIHPTIKEVLSKLKSNGFKMMILTTNDKNKVQKYLEHFGLKEFFDRVISQKFLFQKHRSLKWIQKKFSLSLKDMVYIGDEGRDVEACKRVGVDFIGVTWGYNTERVLREAGARWIVNDPEDIKEILTKNHFLNSL
jgi:phosphoglycolate phosphatase